MMAGDFFLWILAGATLAMGLVLLVAFRRRSRALPAVSKPSRGLTRRLGAVPSEPAEEDEANEDLDLAKICPTCGSRYKHEFRTCKHDNSELAAIN
jgi:hypothetical protein